MRAEVERMLEKAGRHLSVIAAVDGAGFVTHVTPLDVWVGDSTAGGVIVFASYRVRKVRAEGPLGLTDEVLPGGHRLRCAALRLLRRQDGFVLEIPRRLPGLRGMTPIDEFHQTDLLGPSPPFEPRLLSPTEVESQ